MAHRENAPYRAQNPQEIRELIQSLESHKGKGRGRGQLSIKKATFTLPTKRNVDSWRMQDWDYKKPTLPTYARGLFTCWRPDGNPEIVVRGYDKFFNHGEVKKTEWQNVEKNTRGPYELSVKENGCIIFIAGMDDGHLLVCSKHSTGTRGDIEINHAQAGEKWVEKHLASIGKTKVELARKLREMNATAVAELCDDAFEEHVLAYSAETAGLYLHGINLNLPEFATYPHQLVDQFAAEWGFRKTMYIMEDDVRQVKSFLDHVAETGSYAGRETEGFVIRCQARDHPEGQWHDWFFKYKFEEPYLMYRQWRECTKAIIAGKEPKVRKHKQITQEYLTYARRRFAEDPKLAKEYNKNHGIISLRDAFLRERGLRGSDIIRQEVESGEEVESFNVMRNVVLVPIATIGCGKTTIAVALASLFGWGHVQNDNIQGKGRRPQRFAEACCNTLATRPVMIADRNNHQTRERAQLMDDMSKIIPNARFVALHYVHERENYDQVRKATRERVLSRGDNHQTIHAGSKSQSEIIEIMEGFLGRFQPCDASEAPDDAFDLVIDLDVTASSRENLETVISQLSSHFPKIFGAMPSSDDLDNAIDVALSDYKPDIKHELKFGGQRVRQKENTPQQNGKAVSAKPPKPPKLEYFCIQLPATRINTILEEMFQDQNAETARIYRQLSQSRRIQSEFHVTLIHRASATQYSEVWERFKNMYESTRDMVGLSNQDSGGAAVQPGQEPDLGKCRVRLERLVWDNRLMCFVVRLEPDTVGINFESVNETAHITVGTASQGIKPKESNDLLKKWLQVGSGGDTGLKEIMVKGQVVLDGVVKGILQKY